MFRRAITLRTLIGRERLDTERLGSQAQALCEAHSRLPGERLGGCAHVGPGVADVSGAWVEVTPRDRLAQDLSDGSGEPVHRRGGTGCDVEHTAADAPGLAGPDRRLDHVLHVGEV